MFRSFFLPIILAAALIAPSAVCARSKPYEESEKEHSWFSFSRPSRKNPADQLVWARELHADGRLRKAARAYRALAVTWPGSEQAPLAQQGLARTLDARGKVEDAFDAYHELATRYTGGYDYDEVIQRQFEIAKSVMDRRRGSLLIFGGFKAPERAVPLFEKVIQNAPRAPFAPEAQYLIGRAYELSEQLELAVVAYMTAQHRYPASPWAATASFGRARALYRLSEESPNDEEALEQAWAAVSVFLNAFAQSPDAELARAYRETLLRRRAKASYDKAIFYDRLAKRPAAAYQSYSVFVRQFPNSEWTALARARMEQLAPLVEKTDETN
ncbi:MAG TPA: outer membrane protein assembly factor BamD [Kiritimatiellia bacterium]|nr:outer membrane protein assembly factor BamD [Kiritimatiellia bacterium]